MSLTSEKKKVNVMNTDAGPDRYQVNNEIRLLIQKENLLPSRLIERLHKNYPQHSRFYRKDPVLFSDKNYYSGLAGFREIIDVLNKNGIIISRIKEREFFIEVYRFLATRFTLNSIQWDDFENDSIYQLVFPQPEMILKEDCEKYIKASGDRERAKVVEEYIRKTNPHDGKQKLNKPWYINDKGHLEILQGCQHKYPPVALIFDKTTQNCFSYCTYCFRHAQVRGDEDMFVQHEVKQIHEYLKRHHELTDILITGGDAGHIQPDRVAEYLEPIIDDPDLSHIKTVRFGSRALTFQPELLLTQKFKKILDLLKRASDCGIHIIWVAHFSTPGEILNPLTLAAIRRLKAAGITIKSQSPIMSHVSLFFDKNGKTDIEKSARNWIDLGNILGMLGIGFHSMYCARPTGEHHYFSAPLADINSIFSKVYKSLSSVNRPSRFITMTSSAGKVSLLGTAEIKGEKVFALKFNEGRNMDWMDRVYFGKYDEKQNTIEKLEPFEGDSHFYDAECLEIEKKIEDAFKNELSKSGADDK